MDSESAHDGLDAAALEASLDEVGPPRLPPGMAQDVCFGRELADVFSPTLPEAGLQKGFEEDITGWDQLSPELRLDFCAAEVVPYAAAVSNWRRTEAFQSCSAKSDVRPGEKVVHFIRHAEGLHSVLLNGTSLRDPDLTQRGIEQAKRIPWHPELKEALSHQTECRAQLILVSPLRRALATAIHAFNDTLPPSEVPWLLDADLQETADVPCDSGDTTGSASLLQELGREDLLEQYRGLPEAWLTKHGHFATDAVSIHRRFQDFSARLWARPEKNIIAVAHGNLLFMGLGFWKNDRPVIGPLFSNAGVMTYALTPELEWRRLKTQKCAA